MRAQILDERILKMKKNIFEMIQENQIMIRKIQDIVSANANRETETLTPEMLMFTPDEWDIISLIFAHYNEGGKALSKLDDKGKDEWAIENKMFIALIYDLLLCLTARLDKEVSKA